MLTFSPQGGNDLTRAVAAAYQERLTPGAQITNTATDTPPRLAADVLRAVHESHRPISGRELQLQTGYRGAPSGIDAKLRQWQQLRAEMQKQAEPELPAWLEPPTWITSRPARNRR